MCRRTRGSAMAESSAGVWVVSPELLAALPMAQADLDESDIAAVVRVMRSGRLALGPETEAFEREMAAYAGVRHGVAVNSGTSALHLAVRGLGLADEDEVLVPSFTFVATVNAVLYERARPVFVDIEPETYCLDPELLEAAVTPRTRAILPVDVFGHPAPWEAIEDIARRHGLKVIDDCCEALGAEVRGRRLGSFGDAGTFAFYPNKQITTGEGGLLVTDNDELAALARSYRNQGRGEMGAWLEHPRLGYNYRMDEMSASLGRSQLRRLPQFLKDREKVAELYGQRLSHLPLVRLPVVQPQVRMSWFVYVVTLAPGIDRDRVIASMAEMGVPTRAYFSPIHRQPFALDLPAAGSLDVTEDIAGRTLALPFHNQLSADEVDRVGAALEAVLEG